jgi:sugar-specific transcriptional regulator TrmB
MNTEILEDIGFTKAEIKVYISLLELGLSTAGPIIEKSELQSSVVHSTLNKLIKKGFISFVKKGQRNHYQATDPNQISRYIDEKKKEYEKILPELLIKQKFAKEKSEVIAYKDINGIRKLLYELLDAGGKNHFAFGSSKDSLILGETFWINYHNKRADKGIKAKLLFNDSLKKWVKVNKYPKAEYKFTETDFEPLTETIVRNDKVGIILWTESPLGIIINSKAAAESYRKFWEKIWKSS